MLKIAREIGAGTGYVQRIVAELEGGGAVEPWQASCSGTTMQPRLRSKAVQPQ